jgi:hypothetical protein
MMGALLASSKVHLGPPRTMPIRSPKGRHKGVPADPGEALRVYPHPMPPPHRGITWSSATRPFRMDELLGFLLVKLGGHLFQE